MSDLVFFWNFYIFNLFSVISKTVKLSIDIFINVSVFPHLWPWTAEKESNLSPGEHVQLGGPGDHRGHPLHRQADAQGGQDLHLALL